MSSKIKINQKEIVDIIIGLILVILGHVENKTGNLIFLVLAFVAAIMYSIISDKDSPMIISFLLLSDNRLLTYHGISIQLVLYILYILRNIRTKVDKRIMIFAVALTFYSLQYYRYGGISFALQGVKTVIVVIALTIFFTSVVIDLKCCQWLIRVTTIGVGISFIISLIINPNAMFETSRYSLSDESNANILGMLCAFLFTCHLDIYCNNKEKANGEILFLSLDALIAFFTASRTALLEILLAIFSFFWITGYKNMRQFKRKIFFMIVSITVIVALLNIRTVRNQLVFFIERITKPRQGDMSNGRFQLWKMYIEELVNNKHLLFWGQGSAKILTIIGQGGRSQFAHNMWIEQIVLFGVFGMFLVLGLYLNAIKRIKRVILPIETRIRASYLIPIIMLFIGGIFSHLFTSINVTTQIFIGIGLAFSLTADRSLYEVWNG